MASSPRKRTTSTTAVASNGAPAVRPAPDLQALAEQFCERFRGLERFHGHSWLKEDAPAGQKQEAGGEGVHAPVTIDLWAQHLLGIYGVGQTPIRDDATCVFGAIDIDEYDLDHVALATQIDVLRLPLTVVRTKSGGAHLYLFLHEPAKADLVRGKLMEWAVSLGRARVEVFPKQVRLAGAADTGNWINMPYFGAFGPEGTVRYAILQSGDTIRDPAEFLAHAARTAITVEQLAAIKPPMDERHRDLLSDSPPCLQSLATKGFGKGSRNNALFSLGVYLRKRFPDDWQERLDVYNQTFMDPPLPSKEVQAIVRSLNAKKGYFYRCTDDPLVGACNKQICLTRKHGIGQGTDDPGVVFGSLAKINTQPPTWLWDVNGKRIQLTTAELMNQPRFNLRVVDELNVLPTPVKAGRWAEIVRQKLAQAEIIEAPPEVTKPGMLRSFLHQFLARTKIGTEWEAALQKRPVVKGQRIYFSMQEFLLWMQREMKFTIEPRELYVIMREEGLEARQQRCGAKTLQLWSMPVFDGLFATAAERDLTNVDDL